MSNIVQDMPFSQQIAILSRGCTNDELTEELKEVVKAVRATGKSGTITLKLKVSMLNSRDENVVKLTPNVTTTLPKKPPHETIMFSTADGSLLRDDPVQPELGLQIVDAQKPAIQRA